MATFPCAYFTYQTKYPSSGTRIQLGNSYVFAAPPTAPDQRTFSLRLKGMQYFVTAGVLDESVNPERNMRFLELFYETHKLFQTFEFDHPVLGIVNCKFNKPLEIPEGIEGGNGVLNPFEVELIEIP